MASRAIKAVAAAAGAVALVAIGSMPAQALPAANGTPDTLAMVGSDTTIDFMGSYADYWNDPAHVSSTNNTDPDTLLNVPAKLATGQTFTIPANGACPGITYDATNPPPDGSTAGRRALYDTTNQTTACIDIARSSGGRNTSVDPTNAEFYSFARDAVSFATWGSGPIDISLTDLRAIYSCTKTDWSQIPGSGKTGTIHRFLPQAGSGTRDFFINTVLGGSFAADSPTCPLREDVQENTGTDIPAADQPIAIEPYSAGQWVFQNHNAAAGQPDKTAGNFLGSINGIAAVTGDGATAAMNETAVLNGTFVGSRNVYNVLLPTVPSYGQALRAVGVDNLGSSPLCANNADVVAKIRQFGFVPFPLGATGGGLLRSSTCRKS